MEKNKLINAQLRVEGDLLIIEKDGKVYSFELKKISERLSRATDEQLSQFIISPSGYGIHWYGIDEDVSIPALLNEPLTHYGNKSEDNSGK